MHMESYFTLMENNTVLNGGHVIKKLLNVTMLVWLKRQIWKE